MKYILVKTDHLKVRLENALDCFYSLNFLPTAMASFQLRQLLHPSNRFQVYLASHRMTFTSFHLPPRPHPPLGLPSRATLLCSTAFQIGYMRKKSFRLTMLCGGLRIPLNWLFYVSTKRTWTNILIPSITLRKMPQQSCRIQEVSP